MEFFPIFAESHKADIFMTSSSVERTLFFVPEDLRRPWRRRPPLPGVVLALGVSLGVSLGVVGVVNARAACKTVTLG